MTQYRLLALDMDGTLLNDEKEVSDENKKWVRKLDEQDIPVVLTTGRGYQRVIHIQSELNINRPMILVNGAEIWKDKGSLLNRTFIPQEELRKVRDIAMEYEASYWGYKTWGIVKGKDLGRDEPVRDWLKIGVKHNELAVIHEIRDKVMGSVNIECTSSNPHNIECAPRGHTKETGLERVCDHLGISMREVVSVGDHMNDWSMIKAAGLGVAMGNATPELKNIADAVTRTNEENGVANVIRTYFFDK